MNYLAHLFLAEDSRESLIGNLLGDFARGVTLDRQPQGVLVGFRNHHRIDRLTDAHESVRHLRELFFDPLRHYAAVLVDVLFDHVLATTWTRWSAWSLERFATHVYAALSPARELPEGRMREVVPRMIEREFLTAYRHLDGVAGVLGSLERRARRPVEFRAALARWDTLANTVHASFEELFPTLLRAASTGGRTRPPWRRPAPSIRGDHRSPA
ncbi:MAG: DUF479 domain-containing protein [Planctomycetes bacterium]|nr:DUF479 domain-containing protein [Planctomycetota bacterium]